MAEFSALSHDLYCIDALYVHPRVASIYLLRDGDEVAIIETGTSHSVANVLATLIELGIAKSQVRYVIPTHVHLDHAGGAGELMQQFGQAQLIIHPRGAAHMIDPQKLVAGTIGVYGEDSFRQLYGDIIPVPQQRVLVAEDDASFTLGRRDLHFFDTQGHARHHFCIYDAVSQGVFTGDTFGVSYDAMKSLPRGLIPSTPPVQFDPEALHRSVARIMSFKPERLYLTHYGEYLDPASQVSSFNQWIDSYVEICNRIGAVDSDAEHDLASAYSEMMLEAFRNDEAFDNIANALQTDIRLNAQGLAHWWRISHDD